MLGSRIDAIFRSFLLTKYFVKGWGKPQDIERLIKFRRFISKGGECFKLVPHQYPVYITKEEVSNNRLVIEGYFISPFDMYFPELLPPESKKAHFQMLLPLKWKSNKFKPVCLHMAGTGDHFFWRRRELMAKPLLDEGGLASIILENPFYGLRKPKYQTRSILHNVADIFVMGGCLMMEALVLFHWCTRNGLGPLGVTGISMGGHMASLAAASWPYPIVVVPCLSWSTASGVFTEGVMSRAIDWDLLSQQLKTDELYRASVLSSFVSDISDNLFQLENTQNSVPQPDRDFVRRLSLSDFNFEQREKTFITDKIFNKLINARKYFVPLENVNPVNFLKFPDSSSLNSKSYEEALYFMKFIMNECTYLGNFPVPCDTSLAICICALHDGYVPRKGVADLAQIWPGVEVKYLEAGHVTAFLFHLKEFREAIFEGFKRYQAKYL